MKQFFRKALRIFRKLTNNYILSNLEKCLSPKYSDRILHAPIFIIGAPRSGSTLLMQVLTNAFELGYISNMHAQFYGAPFVLELNNRYQSTQIQSSYSSDYGKTKQKSSPSEASSYWYRFFRREPTYVTLNDVASTKMHYLRKSISAFCNAAKKPVIFKNLYNSLRLSPLVHHLPEAIFIVIKRDELDNATSLLKGRWNYYQDYNKWLSFYPPSNEALELLDPAEQVVKQIRLTYDLIGKDLCVKKIKPSRVIEINYEDFCKDVHGQLFRLEKFFVTNNMDVKRRGIEIPSSFERSREPNIDGELLGRLIEYIRQNPI